MKFKIRFADQIVGAFVFLAIIALAGILILMGFNQRWFAKDYQFTSRFQSADGLNPGQAIELKGFQIGSVDKILLNADNSVEIEFHIYDIYWEKVKQNSVLELFTSPIGLGGGLVLHPGKHRGPPIPDGSYVPSLDFPEGRKLVAEGKVEIPEKVDKVASIINSVGPLLENVDAAVVSINRLITEVNDSLTGTSEGVTSDIVKDVRDITTRLNVILADTSERLDLILTETQGTIGNFKALSDKPEGMVTTLLNPEGSVRRFLNDEDALYLKIESALDEMNRTIENIRGITAYLSETTPQISGLLEESRQTLDQGKDVLEGVSNNPLIRGGIPETIEQPTTFQSYRDEDF